MSIADRAVALVAGESDVLPFVLLEQTSGAVVHTTIVTQNSVRALMTGRRVVKQHADDVVAYAIVSDTFIRIEGNRSDALMVEHATRGDATAEIVAYPYTRTAGVIALGAPIPADRRPSALVPFDPHTLPWGAVTPDLYRAKDNHVAHSVNHALATDDDVTRTVRFLRNRTLAFERNMPASPPPIHSAFIDMRGRDVLEAHRVDLIRRLADMMRVEMMEDD